MSPNMPSSARTASSMTVEDSVQVIIIELRRCLLEDLKVAVEEEKLGPHVPLFDDGVGLDSITLFELIAIIEKRYEITFAVESLNSQVFANLEAVARQVHSMLDERGTVEGRP